MGLFDPLFVHRCFWPWRAANQKPRTFSAFGAYLGGRCRMSARPHTSLSSRATAPLPAACPLV